MNVTVPVAVPVPGELTVTVAVKVTDCPETDAPDEIKPMVVDAWLTTRAVAAELVDGPKFASPL